MTAMTAASWGDRAAGLLDSARTAGEVSSKLKQLRQLKVVLLHRDPSILPEFVTRFAELQSEPASPIRKFLAEMISDIGSQHMEVLPKMVPCLISFLEDETPAVARQAITTGTSLYHLVLEKLVIQGLYSSEIDDSVKSSWSWMLQLKSVVFETATQSRNDGIRLRAVKFVEMLILLYTPDPYISSDPPQEPGYGLGFNVSWLRGGHPVLNVGELAMEASQSLGLLLDQLRFPQVKSLSNSIAIVLIKSLSAIAMKRPSFYGRILPVLLSLDPAISVVKGVQIPGAHHALKNAFLACLKCTHSSAEPWRARLVEALKAIDAGESFDQGTDKKIGDDSVGTEDSLATKDDNPSIQVCDGATNDLQRRRSIAEVSNGLPPGDIMPAKRIRQSTDTVQDHSEESHKVTADQVQDSLPAVGSLPSRDKSSGPAQQLVAMFGALVAQGEKAAGSLEILISSISSDLLAEVVMANMQHLPPTCPNAEKEDDLASTMGNSSCVLPAVQLSSLVSDILSLSSSSPLLASLLNVQSSVSHDIDPEKISQSNENNVTDAVNTTLSSRLADDSAMKSASLPVSPLPHATENGSSAVQLHVNLGQDESKIPSVDSTNSFDEIRESHDASHSSIPEPNEISQGHVTSLGEGVLSSIMSAGTINTDATEAQSTGVVHLVSHQTTSTASHVTFPNVLPKMVVLDAKLSDEDKDQLQKEAFIRVLDAYKQVAISGGLDTRFSLLAQLGIEFPLELDAWGLLQKHVLSDYIDHEGHELTLHILDRLYMESEQDLDFLSSRTAISISDTFLLAVAESIRDTFPASDKSLSRLLAEVPYLSEGVLKLLEGLCSPDRSEKHEKDVQNGDRVIQGLSAVWNLILLRSSSRERCLLIALQSAVHPAEDVRMKAIRLVANKLFPMSSISQKIEDFAREKLHSVIDDLPAMVHLETDESTSGLQEDADLGKPSIGGLSNNGLASSTQLDQNVMSSLISEAQRCMSLYFAICTKKHSLLREIFKIYKSISKAAKEAVHRHIPILVRTIGSSPELLAVVSDPPVGSENLLSQVLHTLTDGTTPSQDLIFSVKKLYHSRMKDVEILIPVLSFLPKDEIHPIFPHLVNLPLDKFQAALSRLLQGSSKTGPCLTPAEVLIAIHGIDPEKDGVPLKKVMDACSTCFEQRNVFTQQVLAKVLNQLVEQIPLPLLFMRTVLQAIGTFPSLVDFVMEILSRLVSKQIWKYPKLWVGFLKCAIQMKPQSFPVLLQLPAAQLENALNKNPLLKTPLADHANQPNIRATLPRSTLVVLGLVQDSQASSQAQTSHSQAADTGSSTAEMTAEVTQESSAVS